jgi:hypothetical protein
MVLAYTTEERQMMAQKEFAIGDRAVITPLLRSHKLGTKVTVVGHTEVWGVNSMITVPLVVKDGSDFPFGLNAGNLIPLE